MIFLSVMCTPSCISDALLHVTPQRTQEMVSSFCHIEWSMAHTVFTWSNASFWCAIIYF